MSEPHFCARCGLKRRATQGTRFCYDCMRGGPFTPPPCKRCGTTEDYFAAGMCGGCHRHGPKTVDSCGDCYAWGATRHTTWRCGGCVTWRRQHRRVDTCGCCHREVTVNARGFCRMCWIAGSGHHIRGRYDPIGGNRHGQQLWFVGMRRAASAKGPTVARPAPTWPAGRPVTHQQLVAFTVTQDFSRGRLPLPPPRDLELAAVLDAIALDYARSAGWHRTKQSKARSGIRILLGLQDTPGAPIGHREMVNLPRLLISIAPIVEILDTVGMYADDRSPAVERRFRRQISGLPAAMAAELTVWFDIMANGTATPPRRKARSHATIKAYLIVASPVLEDWAARGHGSLREITRAQVLAALPAEPANRKLSGQAMRSIFGILKARKVIFTNPAVRLAHTTEAPIPPPAIDLELVRAALNAPDPARAAIAALVAFHGLRSAQLRQLHLTNIHDRHLHLDQRTIPLAQPVRARLATWLAHRNRRWPDSTNPYLFVHLRTAHHHRPVGNRWVYLTLGLPGGTQALREDRILHEAIATGGDARRLCDLFGLSISHASRYTDAIAEPALPT